jgi:hypothetical protein
VKLDFRPLLTLQRCCRMPHPQGSDECIDKLSQERMTYLQEESKVLYQSKNRKMEKTFDGLERLATMTSHVPNRVGRPRWFHYLLSLVRFSTSQNLRSKYHTCLFFNSATSADFGKPSAALMLKSLILLHLLMLLIHTRALKPTNTGVVISKALCSL